MRLHQLFLDAFASPGRAFAAAIERRSILAPLLAATLASLLLAAALLPRLDFDRAALDLLDRAPNAADVTPFQREEALASARKLGSVLTVAGAAAGPALSAVGLAFFLWIAFRVAGTRPGLRDTLVVVSWSLLPRALEALLSIPAALTLPSVDPQAVSRIGPWSAGWFLGPAIQPPLLALATSVNLFALWSAVLLAVGMAPVAGASRSRAGAVVALVCAALVAVGMAAAGAGAPTA
ncbi:MAG: YIP1 family protein [Deltaproteobacteria bacterium]|nr:YIP1 family protein [Deltaproteobacteria bacterium]